MDQQWAGGCSELVSTYIWTTHTFYNIRKKLEQCFRKSVWSLQDVFSWMDPLRGVITVLGPLRPELRSAPADWSLWSKALTDSCIRGSWRKLWLMRRHLRDRNVYMHRWPLIYQLQRWCNSYSSLCRLTLTEKFSHFVQSLKFVFCGNN